MEQDELVVGRSGTIFRTLNYLYRYSGLQHRTLITFVNSTLLEFTQLHEYVLQTVVDTVYYDHSF